jgi:3-deoxy-D-manno-octulosonic-acid transferase
LALFSNKLELFISGRKLVFDHLKSKGVNRDSWVWFHAASLGEFEQARPLILEYKRLLQIIKFYLLFFHPRVMKFKKNLMPLTVFVIYLGTQPKT